MHSSLELKREVDAIQIPSGDMVKLPLGMKVIITQSLGGTYTVATDFGLARINALDADALGIDPAAEKKADADSSSNIPMEATDLEMEVWNQLKNVYDPEIPVNIVDLGLIYGVTIAPSAEVTGRQQVSIDMTMTSPACPAGPQLIGDTKRVIGSHADVASVEVRIVMDPPWTPDRMTEAARDQLGIF